MFANPSARKRIRGGELLFGCFINTASPFSTMIAAQVGFDVVLLDHEHGPGDFHDARHCMDAAMGTGSEIWVRVPGNEQNYLKRILDCGADGIMCPLINTAEEARDLVRSCHYPPAGIRGVAPGFGRHTAYGTRREEYMNRVADDLTIMAQIESVEGVANVDAIAEVEGIDIIFVGPFDLSASLGHMGKFDHPDVVAAIDTIEAATKKAGKRLATLATPGRDAASLRKRGYGLVFSGSDVNFLRSTMENSIAALEEVRRLEG
jgi:4-hydroxy-2-oxoheptanedioate aldolase